MIFANTAQMLLHLSTMIEKGFLNCKLEDLDMLDDAMFCLCQTCSVKLHKYLSETEQPGEWALHKAFLRILRDLPIFQKLW